VFECKRQRQEVLVSSSKMEVEGHGHDVDDNVDDDMDDDVEEIKWK